VHQVGNLYIVIQVHIKTPTSAVWSDCIVLCCLMHVQAEVPEFTCITFNVYDRLHKQSPLDKKNSDK